MPVSAVDGTHFRPFQKLTQMQPDSPPKKADVLIAFGANEGDGELALEKAVEMLREDAKVLEIRHSRPFVTKAVTGEPDQTASQQEYVNAAIRVLTTYTPTELHAATTRIEQQLGRQRAKRWGPRTIDLDLLLYNDHQINLDTLTIPHPRMTFRRFVLEPALQIAAEMVHPVSGMTLQQLVDHLNKHDQHVVVATNAPEHFETLAVPEGWKLEFVTNTGEFMKQAIHASLVASFFEDTVKETDKVEESAALARFAANFAGPVLKIRPEQGEVDAIREIQAAIEAMQLSS